MKIEAVPLSFQLISSHEIVQCGTKGYISLHFSCAFVGVKTEFRHVTDPGVNGLNHAKICRDMLCSLVKAR